MAVQNGWSLSETMLLHPDAILDCPLQIPATASMSSSPFSQNNLFRGLESLFIARAELAEKLRSQSLGKVSTDTPADENDPIIHIPAASKGGSLNDGFIPEEAEVMFVRIRRDGVESDTEKNIDASFALATESETSPSAPDVSSARKTQAPERRPFNFPLILNTERWAREKAEETAEKRELAAKNRKLVEESLQKLAVLVGPKVRQISGTASQSLT